MITQDLALGDLDAKWTPNRTVEAFGLQTDSESRSRHCEMTKGPPGIRARRPTVTEKAQ